MKRKGRRPTINALVYGKMEAGSDAKFVGRNFLAKDKIIKLLWDDGTVIYRKRDGSYYKG